jgi:hypothetical protein
MNHATIIKSIFVLVLTLSGYYMYTQTISPQNNTSTPPTNQRTTTASKDDLIRIFDPLTDQTISSPLTITGEARGTWYFEASFPVTLVDANGTILTQAPAQAQGDWMTKNYVPFRVTLTFITTPTTETGTLILEKDNPSGLPENPNELRIPVRFKKNTNTSTQTIQLYYYNPNNDKDAQGNIKCSKEGLVAVLRQIPTTMTPLADSINTLLKGELTAQEKAQGITTEYELEGVTLQKAEIVNGVATLTFIDPQNKTSGGSCRAGILWNQIEATAKQFPTVTSVRFQPEELFQP